MRIQLKQNKVMGIFVTLIFFVVSVLFATPTLVRATETEQRVFDEADLFSQDEIQLLEQEIIQLQPLMNADVAILTTIDTGGLSTFDFADLFFTEHDLGFGNDDDGVLFIIDMDNREIDMVTDGKMIDYLTDARIDSILEDAFDAIVDGDYFGTATAFLSGVEHYYRQGLVEGQYRLTDQRVFDYVNAFSDNEVQELVSLINELENLMDMDVVIATTNNMQGRTARSFIDEFYQVTGFAARTNPNGVTLLIDTENSEVHLVTDGVMDEYLTETRLKEILTNVSEEVNVGNYFSASKTFLANVETFYDEGIPTPPLTWQEVAVMLVISVGVGGLFYGIVVAKYKSGTSKPTFALRQNSNLRLTNQQDRFINQRVSKTRLPKDPPPSSGGGSSGGGSRSATRSTVRSSSSGGSRGGGRGRSF